MRLTIHGIAGLMLLTLAPLSPAQMRELRPLPQDLDGGGRIQLGQEHAKAVTDGGLLCSAHARYKLECEGKPDSEACQRLLADFNARLQAYNQEADRYNDDAVGALKQREAKLAKGIRDDQQAIRLLGLHRDAEEFDSWTQWLKDADAERVRQSDAAFRDAAMSAVTAGIQAAARAGANRAASVTPEMAERLIARLRAAGIVDAVLMDLIRRYAAAEGKQQVADAGVKLLDRLAKNKALWGLKDLGPDKESATWRAGSSVLEIVVPDPRMQLLGKLTLDEVRATFYTVNEAGADFPVFDAQVTRLTRLTEEQLLILRSLSKRLQSDVSEHAKAAQALADVDKAPGEDVCRMRRDASSPVASSLPEACPSKAGFDPATPMNAFSFGVQ